MVDDVDAGMEAPKQRKIKSKPKPRQMPFEQEVETEEGRELLGPIDEDEIENMLEATGVEIKRKAANKPKAMKAFKAKPKAAPKIEVRPKLKEAPAKAKPKPAPGPELEPEVEIALGPPANVEAANLMAETKSEEIKHLELAPSQPPAPLQIQQLPSQSPQGEKPFAFIKWFLFGMLLVAIVAGSYFFFHKMPVNVPELPKTGLAVYEPADLLTGWTLEEARTNLAQIPSDLRAGWITQGVKDGALWHYTKDSEDVFVWVRVYPDRETLKNNDKEFWNVLSWLSTTYVGIGDRARLGIYRGDPTAKYPLALYSDKDDTMVYVAYYNQNGAYNDTDKFADERFLVSLTRGMLMKIFGEEIPEENIVLTPGLNETLPVEVENNTNSS